MAENKIKPGGLAMESGRSWRLSTRQGTEDISIENEGIFDELVLDHWFHMERMQERLWWLRVGDARLLLELHDDGSAALEVERGFYEDVVELSRPERPDGDPGEPEGG